MSIKPVVKESFLEVKKDPPVAVIGDRLLENLINGLADKQFHQKKRSFSLSPRFVTKLMTTPYDTTRADVG